MNCGSAPVPKPYLYAEELAVLTPWSVAAIHKMVQRLELHQGVHYFQDGYRTRLIFKWAAIVELIESGGGRTTASNDGKIGNGRTLDVETAAAGLRRLLG